MHINEIRYAIYNIELNRLLTSATGTSVFTTEEKAEEVRDVEFGGGNHLEVVKVERIDE